MHNRFANFVKILGVCKHFYIKLVNEHGNNPFINVILRGGTLGDYVCDYVSWVFYLKVEDLVDCEQ